MQHSMDHHKLVMDINGPIMYLEREREREIPSSLICIHYTRLNMLYIINGHIIYYIYIISFLYIIAIIYIILYCIYIWPYTI